jgi:hypothetical protein
MKKIEQAGTTAPETPPDERWLTRGVAGIRGASLLADNPARGPNRATAEFPRPNSGHQAPRSD